MLTRLSLFGFILVAAFGYSSAQKELPALDSMAISPYGSHIRIEKYDKEKIEGELIAVDSASIYVLTDQTGTPGAIIVPADQVQHYEIFYARRRNYEWTIPVYSLSTISHGWWLIFSLPVNLIATIMITIGGKRAYRYTEYDISYDELKMFARFPQGIPEGVELQDIR